MGKTKFVKVSIEDRLPKKSGFYFVFTNKGEKESYFDGERFSEFLSEVKMWLCEVPDREDEIMSILKEILNDLKEDTEDFPTGYYFEKLNNYLTN